MPQSDSHSNATPARRRTISIPRHEEPDSPVLKSAARRRVTMAAGERDVERVSAGSSPSRSRSPGRQRRHSESAKTLPTPSPKKELFKNEGQDNEHAEDASEETDSTPARSWTTDHPEENADSSSSEAVVSGGASSSRKSLCQSSQNDQEVPICQRSACYRFVDWSIIVLFGAFLVIAWTVDYVNAVSPADKLITRDSLESWLWPPAAVKDAVVWWCEQYDPLLQNNPLWLKVLCMFSPFVYTFFYIPAMCAVYTGSNNIRIPSLIYAYGLFITLTAVCIDALYGVHKTSQPLIFISAYGPYWIGVPALLCWRFWAPNPFSAAVVGKSN